MTIRIANGAGFLGDNLDASRLLVESAEVDYLTLEYLAELTMSILARIREKDPNAGYAGDFLDVLRSVGLALSEQPQLNIVTNAGGVNPIACAKAAAAILNSMELGEERIGVVTGDDLLSRLNDLRAEGCNFDNLETGQPISVLAQPIVSANAYLGARPIVDCLASDSRIVITGRVADASLTVAPAIHRFNWDWTDWDRIAEASVAGHLIECGAQVTGGYSNNWRDLNLETIGYPIAEITSNGKFVITKPTGSGGVVNRQAVVEQLVYEIGDPGHYLTPDVDVDFTSVEVEEIAPNRVAVRGAKGAVAPDDYKVSLAYHDGFTASGQLVVFGRDCVEKARTCAELVFKRVENAGFTLAQTHAELLGTGVAMPRRLAEIQHGDDLFESRELVLRMSVQDSRRDAVLRFTKEIAPLITSGPAGLAGYAAGRSSVRAVYSYWPTLVPKQLIQPVVEIRAAKDWAEESDV